MMYTTRFRTHHDASRKLKDLCKVEVDKDKYVMETLNKEAKNERVLYIHVPYCNKICSFCPFHRPDKMKRDEYYLYIVEELLRLSKYEYAKKPLSAINFGGGTPTAIRPLHMKAILDCLKDNFTYKDDIEISVESSITELSHEMIKVLKEGGVNRLSLGVQTFHNDARKLLNRRGGDLRVIHKIKELKENGFKNINIDLIYNYPGQTVEMLRDDLEMIKKLDLAGISFYALMIHEKTPIASLISKENLQEMNDFKHEFELFQLIVEELQTAGYEPFEFTKLVRNHLDHYLYMDIRHNQGDCIAVGLGAGGNIGNYIYHNKEGFRLLEESKISAMGRYEEDTYFILDEIVHNLEREKFTFQKYSDLLNMDLFQIWKPILNRLQEENMIVIKEDKINYTLLGRFYGNNIIDELMGELAHVCNHTSASLSPSEIIRE